jgi:hypothetical protein
MRRLLLALPAVAVSIVLWAVLTAGWAQPVEVARVLGGPTRGSTSLSWLVFVERLEAGQRRPSPRRALRVSARAGTQSASWTGQSDPAGLAEVRIELERPLDSDPSVRIESADGVLLAEGVAALSGENWRSAARRHGGWLPGQQLAGPAGNELWLRVAPAEGTFAVPFASELIIEVTRGPALAAASGGLLFGAQPVSGAELELELSGAEPAIARARSDAGGRARVAIRPQEHAIVLRLAAHASAPGAPALTARWYGALPVTPGALHAALEGTHLLVRSPIPRDMAFVSLVDGERRLAGYLLELTPDAEGGARASVELTPPLLRQAQLEDVFAVASSEPDKRSASSVGWPLRRELEPAWTFDAPDQLLLDGSAGALARESAQRRQRRWTAALLLSLVGALTLGAFARELRAPRRGHPSGPEAQLAGADTLQLGSQRWWIGLALACLLLGLGALAYFGLLQR